MAKIYGLFGSMTGKLADTVMAVRNGEQLARKYQPVVYNPSTEAQVAQRAKLKLLSQLSAVMGPFIAIPKQGSVSSRNLFTKKNFPLTTYSGNQADITLANVQLTSSVVAFPTLGGERSENSINVYIYGGSTIGTLDVDRVVYIAFVKQADNSLRFLGSSTVTESGGGTWNASFPLVHEEVIVYAYGVRDNSEAARVAFGNLTAATAEAVAKLLVTRTLTESDVTITETVSKVYPVANRDGGDETKKSKK